MKSSDLINNYIEYIRYPRYRNLEQDAKINFDFPLTFFVGKNGGGKSSTLQSLYGCPLNYSLSDFWFSTAIDPIQELKTNRNCLIYGYKKDGEIKEVLKQRAQRRGKLDYWEPSKPVKKYGMDLTRNPPLTKNVEYIDFRSELSAFDSYMYFMPFDASKSIKSKQDYIRRYSQKLKEAFDSGKEITHFRIKKNEVVKILSDREVKAISKILGKEYSTIEILDHKFFKNWGFSVRFTSPNLSYSEAFAGSGETAIIVLIHKIENCENGTLLLLDEPETSLHSGAQKRLRNYLLEQIKIKKLQVVISTHSPFFIENMPSDSIKVFSMNKDGSFHVENEREPREAFYELEIDNTNEKHQVIVEDKLAKNIILYILSKQGDDIKNSFNIKYLPGGSASIKQRLASYIEIDSKPIIIFDGDQKLLDSHIDLNNIPANQTDTFEKLEDLLLTQTNCKIKFFIDGNKDGGNINQKIELIKQYFSYYEKNVFYLPSSIPEDIIWDDEYALKKLEDIHGKQDKSILDTIKSGDSKNWFLNLCEKIYSDTISLEALQKEFIMKWYAKNDENLENIKNIIETVRSQNANA
jgi:predicted ATPase